MSPAFLLDKDFLSVAYRTKSLHWIAGKLIVARTTRTVNTPLQKDQSIIRLLDRLRALLDPQAFDVVDHWENDLCSVGIARPDNNGVLVYICSSGVPGDRCSVSLELPPQPHSDIPYTAAGDQDAASLEELAEIVRRHFEYDRTA